MNLLFENQKGIFTSIYFKITLYLFSAFIYAHFSGLSLPDDGLRHIAFAAHSDVMHSWGEVFPHSLFFTNYDPWFVWHAIIKAYLIFFPYESVHIAINTTVLFFMMILLDRLFVKYSSLKESPLVIFIILSIVLITSFRYISVRPDLLSGLFLFSVLLLHRYTLLIFILTVLYSSSYYLFFLYTGSLGIVYILLKEYKTLAALFFGSLIGLAFQAYMGGEDFFKTILYLLQDQSLREGLDVREGLPLIDILKKINYYLLVLIAWSISAIIIYTNYNYFKRKHIPLLLLVMSPLWLAQIRYFLLLEPLFFLYLFLEMKTLLHLFFSRTILYYLYTFFHLIKSIQYKTIFILPALFYSSFMFGYMMNKNDYSTILKDKEFYLNKKFDNTTILINRLTLDIYYALYLNPSIKFIPSCSVGWFEKNKKMKDIYVRMMKKEGITEEELKKLLTFVDADYYMHFFENKKQILSFEKLKKLDIESSLILDNRILFKNNDK